jgi:hypothetical protein
MRDYTVIGFWADTEQRFATVLRATSAETAESACLAHHPGLGICGVVQGSHLSADASPYIAYGEGEIGQTER